jgi:hypothetical protein
MNHFSATKNGPSRSGWRGCWPHFLPRATTCSDRYQKPLPPALSRLSASPRNSPLPHWHAARPPRFSGWVRPPASAASRLSSRSASSCRPGRSLRVWRFPAGALSGLLSSTGKMKLGTVKSYSDCPTVAALGGRDYHSISGPTLRGVSPGGASVNADPFHQRKLPSGSIRHPGSYGLLNCMGLKML